MEESGLAVAVEHTSHNLQGPGFRSPTPTCITEAPQVVKEGSGGGAPG